MKHTIGQQLIIGLRGPSLLKEEADFIVKHNVGGVILFKRNYQSPELLHKLCTEVQALRHKLVDKVPLFIGIDMEGGRVARLGAPFTQWPPAAALGKIDSTSVAFKFALQMGTELRAVGVNLNFAPCVDVLTNPSNTAIGDRALSSDPEQVAKIASAVVRGFIKSEIMPCAKHFPGHGDTIIDSHDDLPVENKSMQDLQKRELIPFKKVFRARLDMVMTSHIKFPQIDPEWPATLSPKFITDLLRKEFRYRNLVITDDLGMGALVKNYAPEVVAVQALKAGVNILLYCNEFSAPPVALAAIEKALTDGSLSPALVQENYKKILEIKRGSIGKPDPLPMSDVAKLVGHPDHLRMSKAIASGQVPADLIVNTPG